MPTAPCRLVHSRAASCGKVDGGKVRPDPSWFWGKAAPGTYMVASGNGSAAGRAGVEQKGASLYVPL